MPWDGDMGEVRDEHDSQEDVHSVTSRVSSVVGLEARFQQVSLVSSDMTVVPSSVEGDGLSNDERGGLEEREPDRQGTSQNATSSEQNRAFLDAQPHPVVGVQHEVGSAPGAGWSRPPPRRRKCIDGHWSGGAFRRALSTPPVAGCESKCAVEAGGEEAQKRLQRMLPRSDRMLGVRLRFAVGSSVLVHVPVGLRPPPFNLTWKKGTVVSHMTALGLPIGHCAPYTVQLEKWNGTLDESYFVWRDSDCSIRKAPEAPTRPLHAGTYLLLGSASQQWPQASCPPARRFSPHEMVYCWAGHLRWISCRVLRTAWWPEGDEKLLHPQWPVGGVAAYQVVWAGRDVTFFVPVDSDDWIRRGAAPTKDELRWEDMRLLEDGYRESATQAGG